MDETKDLHKWRCYLKWPLRLFKFYIFVIFEFISKNSKKVYEEDIFRWQDILQFFSGEFKDYKYVKFTQTLGALTTEQHWLNIVIWEYDYIYIFKWNIFIWLKETGINVIFRGYHDTKWKIWHHLECWVSMKETGLNVIFGGYDETKWW